MADESKWLVIRVEPELHKAVQDAAKQDRRTMTAWVNVQLERATLKQTRREQQEEDTD